MRILSIKPLREHWKKHPPIEHALRTWYRDAERAEWTDPHDLLRQHPKASIIGRGTKRVVFNIDPGAHRLVVDVNYRFQAIFVVAVLTHTAYDRVDVTKLHYNG